VFPTYSSAVLGLYTSKKTQSSVSLFSGCEPRVALFASWSVWSFNASLDSLDSNKTVALTVEACDTHNKAGQKRVKLMSSQDVVTIKDKELGTK
jgi:hypothetical protein